MKKLGFLLMTALMMAFIAPGANAQKNSDSMMFNHLSIGAEWGLLARVGVDVAAPIGPKFDVRAGFYTSDITTAIGLGVVESSLSSKPADGLAMKNGTITYTLDKPINSNGMDISKFAITPKTHTSNLELLFDFFPGKGKFHITAGAFFALNPDLFCAQASALNASGQSGIPKSDWGNTSFFGVSTDKSGDLHLDIKYGLSVVKPFLGIGFGRPISLDTRVGFNFDFGVYYIGGLHVYSYDYTSGGEKAVELNSAWINKYDDLKENIGKNKEVLDALDLLNGFPVLPMCRFSIFVRLF